MILGYVSTAVAFLQFWFRLQVFDLHGLCQWKSSVLFLIG